MSHRSLLPERVSLISQPKEVGSLEFEVKRPCLFADPTLDAAEFMQLIEELAYKSR